MCWVGAVHEVVTPVGNVLYSDFAVTHRKTRPSDPDRNLRIYQAQLAAGKQLEPRQQFYYGRELYYHHRWEEALDVFERFLEEGQGWVENNIDACSVHVNHGIRGAEADRDEAFARELCRTLQVPFIALHCQVPEYAAEHGLSEEEAGRILRYQILEAQAEAWEREFLAEHRVKIALAHHRNDNAETILHHLLRGSGLTGLAGIRPVQERRIRPLLGVGRGEIREYLNAEGIGWCEDTPWP